MRWTVTSTQPCTETRYYLDEHSGSVSLIWVNKPHQLFCQLWESGVASFSDHSQLHLVSWLFHRQAAQVAAERGRGKCSYSMKSTRQLNRCDSSPPTGSHLLGPKYLVVKPRGARQRALRAKNVPRINRLDSIVIPDCLLGGPLEFPSFRLRPAIFHV